MTPLRLMLLCFLVVLMPFLISVGLTLATSGEEEYEHAQSGGDRTGSPACLTCRTLLMEIEGLLEQDPLPPIAPATQSSSSSSTSRKEDSGDGANKKKGKNSNNKGSSGRKSGASKTKYVPSDDNLDPDRVPDGGMSGTEAEDFDSPDQEIMSKVSAVRRDRANDILQNVCRLQYANQKDLCQRILRRQRKEVLSLIFNISEEVTPEWVCTPMCLGNVFDLLGDAALRMFGHTVIRRVWRTLLELWGPVLILTTIGSLLGMTLHVRVAASKLLLVTESISSAQEPYVAPEAVEKRGGGHGNSGFEKQQQNGKVPNTRSTPPSSTGGKHNKRK